MGGKEIGAIIGLIVLVPTLLSLLVWTYKVSNDPGNPEHLQEGMKIAIESKIPWWLGIFEWLAGLPGIIAAIAIVVFFLFLGYIGAIK